MAVAKQCDKCKRFYEASWDRVYKFQQYNNETEEMESFPVNSFRIGYWDQKTKSWKNIASAYDLCDKCAKAICDVIFGEDSEIVMRQKVNPKIGYSKQTVAIEDEQRVFAANQEE